MLKKLFWTIFLVLIFIIGFKLVPIYYAAISLEGICQENADLYHRYSKNYILTKINEELDHLGIPKNQREVAVTKTKEDVLVEIYYEDTADFFGYYTKDYVFIRECSGVLTSVVK